jgi:pimeloyl-ACP methyl ester carboxylesterase
MIGREYGRAADQPVVRPTPTECGTERPRRRRVLTAVAAVGAAAGVIGLALRETSPVGHFTSAAAKDRFITAYDRAMADLRPPQRTLDVRTSFGVVRAYRFAGAQPTKAPLMLLPGRASASPVWADNLPALLKLRSVYTIDLLGESGLSIQDRPIASDADQAQWLNELLLQLPEPRVHLVGLSIGGWTTANLLVNQPSKVTSATLLDPVYVFSDLSLEAILRSIPASVRWCPKAWRDNFTSWTAGGAPVKDVPVAQMIEAGMQTYALHLPAPSRIPEDRIAAVRQPVMVIMAGRSPMHDSAVAADCARRSLQHGTVRVYPRASHAINGEYPDEIAADIDAFLAAVE